MFVIVGAVLTTVCVIMGYVLHHGNLAVLWQPTELLIIGGAAVGSLVMATSPYIVKGIIANSIKSLKGSGVNKAAYIELLFSVNCIWVEKNKNKETTKRGPFF